MTELTGTATLIRLILRRDRLRILIWIAAIAAVELLTARSTMALYPTVAALRQAAAAEHGNAAAIAINGPDQALDTIGGQVAFQIGATGLVAIALMALFMTGRHTRAEEESGRLDMIRSMAVGRHAASLASVTVVACVSVAVGAIVALGLTGLNLPTAGSALLGASLSAEGILFAAIALVASQLSENTRVVYGSAGAVLGIAFAVRAVGDIGNGDLSWLSPIGWAQKTQSFSGDRWWPLTVMAAVTIGLVALGAFLTTRRDADAGFVRPRPGARTASAYLGHPLGLALRLQRGSLIGWATGMLLAGGAIGWIANDVKDLVGDNEALRKTIAQLGGVSITDSYLSTEMLFMALISAGFAIQSILQLRGEEAALRAEALLAAPVSRQRWIAGHLTTAMGGSVVVLAAAGLGSGLTYGLVIHDPGQILRMLGAAVIYVPALWLFIGLATLLFGLVPRGTAAVWAAFAACFVIGLLGNVLKLPAWAEDLSPFKHTPRLPGAEPAITPLTILLTVAIGLTFAGIIAFRRRDLG